MQRRTRENATMIPLSSLVEVLQDNKSDDDDDDSKLTIGATREDVDFVKQDEEDGDDDEYESITGVLTTWQRCFRRQTKSTPAKLKWKPKAAKG